MPSDAGYELDAVTRVLASASGPASERVELSGEAAAVAAFVQVTGRSVPAPTGIGRKRMLASAISSKLALAVAVGAASLGGVAAAAYANALPGPIQDAAHNLIGAAASQDHATSSSHPGASASGATPTAATPTPAEPTSTPVGPNATGRAMYGLCTAYAAASAHGNALNSVAFRNLATAAGGIRQHRGVLRSRHPAQLFLGRAQP